MKMSIPAFIFFTSFILATSSTEASYFDTLPEGRFNLQYRRIKTNSVVSNYDTNGLLTSNNINFKLNAESLMGSNQILDEYFSDLKNISSEAYLNFQIGAYEIKPVANIEVEVLGFGYGLGDKTTAYFGIPFYKASVKVDFNRTEGNNYKEISEMVEDSDSGIVGRITQGLPDISEGIIQTVLTEYYGTKALGTWTASGPGDLEAGIMHQLHKDKSFGSLIKFGTVLPTGKVEDPDILQDISFGDGQVDVFFEGGVGGKFLSHLGYTLSARYTYQMDSQKTYRVPDVEGVSLGVNKTQVTEKLGNKIDLFSALSFEAFDLFTFQLGHYFNHQQKTTILSSNGALFKGSNIFSPSQGHSAEVKFTFSTVKSYLKNKSFFLPFDLSASYLKTLSGINIQEVNRSTLQLSMYF